MRIPQVSWEIQAEVQANLLAADSDLSSLYQRRGRGQAAVRPGRERVLLGRGAGPGSGWAAWHPVWVPPGTNRLTRLCGRSSNTMSQ